MGPRPADAGTGPAAARVARGDAEQIAARIGTPDPRDVSLCIQLSGKDAGAQRAVAARACAHLGLGLGVLRATDVPATAPERALLARLWERQAALAPVALLLELGDASEEEARAPLAFAEILGVPLLVTSREPVFLRRLSTVRIEVLAPRASEQTEVWRQTLPERATCSAAALELVAGQFQSSWDTVQVAATLLRDLPPADATAGGAAADASAPTDTGQALWQACRIASRRRLDGLAARVSTVARFETWCCPPRTWPRCARSPPSSATVRASMTPGASPPAAAIGVSA